MDPRFELAMYPASMGATRGHDKFWLMRRLATENNNDIFICVYIVRDDLKNDQFTNICIYLLI